MKTFRCYVKYTRQIKRKDRDGHWYKKTVNRKGKYVYVSAVDRDRAIAWMREAGHIDPRKGEDVVHVKATAMKEDQALRAMGAKPLPLKFD
jgi:hypothetical protein